MDLFEAAAEITRPVDVPAVQRKAAQEAVHPEDDHDDPDELDADEHGQGVQEGAKSVHGFPAGRVRIYTTITFGLAPL